MSHFIRSIWVTRWDYKKPQDIKSILHNCATHGFNQIIFQIRGNATAFYKSKYEPWAWELTGKDPQSLGKDPGWDPLQTAIDECKKLNLELHAYLNVFPGWRGKTPPPKKVKQVFNTHRNWFGKNEGGDYQPLGDDYITLCPGIPAVRDYLEKIYLQVVRDYDVHGIHFDYVRYYNDLGEYSLDPVSIKLFQKQYKKHPVELPDQWSQWKRDAVTDLVRRVSKGTKQIKKHCQVSASIWCSYYNGYSRFYQDSWGWFQEGLLDFATPMNYTPNNALYKHWSSLHIKHSHGTPVYPGVGVLWEKKNNSSDYFTEQLKINKRIGASGVAIFAYNCLFPKHKPNSRAKSFLKFFG